jgi:hypothetical protein
MNPAVTNGERSTFPPLETPQELCLPHVAGN